MSKKDEYGKIPLASGNIFRWMRSGTGDGEIYGMVEKPDGSLLKGASGWYRTNDEMKAARIAEDTHIKKNPAPRIGTRRALRRSQATGRAPSRRLVRRRRRNTAKGFFPNPSQAAALQRLAYGNPMKRKKRRIRRARKTRAVRRARRSRGSVPPQFAGLPFLLKSGGVIVAGFRDKKRAIQYGRKLARHTRGPVALMKR